MPLLCEFLVKAALRLITDAYIQSVGEYKNPS